MKLSIRVNRSNTDHHLWNNNGTWWCHYTLERPAGVIRRIRTSLGTRDRGEARTLRDELFAALSRISTTGSDRIATTGGREVASC